jgi:arylsulfatase A-like enzyme
VSIAPNRRTLASYLPRVIACAAILLVAACTRDASPSSGRHAGLARQPSILLVTLDTTRADAIGPGSTGVDTPAFSALAARGRRFTQAYATVPETLPSHTSMMTGLYPAGHGVHENGRRLSDQTPLLAERLHGAGYHTAAFVSTFTLARRFGLARGFDVYDDELAGAVERSSAGTTAAALTLLDRRAGTPLFLWVHYNDPHAPYEPPEPYRSRYAGRPYLGEVAAMDARRSRTARDRDCRGSRRRARRPRRAAARLPALSVHDARAAGARRARRRGRSAHDVSSSRSWTGQGLARRTASAWTMPIRCWRKR